MEFMMKETPQFTQNL